MLELCLERGEIGCSTLALVWQLAKLGVAAGQLFRRRRISPMPLGLSSIGQTQFLAVGSDGRSREWGGGQPTPHHTFLAISKLTQSGQGGDL